MGILVKMDGVIAKMDCVFAKLDGVIVKLHGVVPEPYRYRIESTGTTGNTNYGTVLFHYRPF